MSNSGKKITAAPIEVVKYPGCFVCGDKNSSGLSIKFFWDGEVCRTEFVAEERFCGYHRLLHGGIISTILDEVMIKAILADGIVAVTGEMTIKYRAPVYTGERLTFEGRIIERKKRLFMTSGVALFDSGVIAAESSGRYLQLTDPERLAGMQTSLAG